jgi:hypothetical protein
MKLFSTIIAALLLLVAAPLALAQNPDGTGRPDGAGKPEEPGKPDNPGKPGGDPDPDPDPDPDLIGNVEQLGSVPAPAGIGANFKEIDGKQYMFVTGSAGLYVYDTTNAASPAPVSALPLPHYENEDVSIGGDRLLLSGDGTAGGSNLVVIDISDPQVPMIEQVINMQLLDEGHTATCIQECRYVWVAGGGSVAVIDLDQDAQFETPDGAPDIQVQGAESAMEVGDLRDPADGNGPFHEFGWSTHDVQVDEAGIAWVVGGNGTIGFDVRPEAYPVAGKEGTTGLLEPTVVARTGSYATGDSDFDTVPGSMGSGDTLNDFIHHNSWRPDASEFESRSDDELADSSVRPGELVLVTEEDIWNRDNFSTPGGCESQGSFQTWQVKQFGATGPETGTVENLDSWTTEFNELVADDQNPLTGNDVIPTKGFCSSHYFSERDGVVATAWYEQGIRFLDVRNPRDIKQKAFYMPEGATMWAAYWAPNADDIVYSIDNTRGLVDVLRYEETEAEASGAVEAPLADHWFDGETTAVQHAKYGWVCRLGGV